MNAHFRRAALLMQQSRTDLAEQELRLALADDPNEARAHGLLAVCLAQREAFREALVEAGQAVHLAPDDSFTHYTLSGVLYHSNRPQEAEQAIQEAIRLDPTDPDYFARLASIRFDLRNWNGALEAAGLGLQFDPEHAQCINLRAMALVKLGRQDEAGAALETALQRDPENALTHANQGWRLLEQGEHRKALEHFREALRIDSELDYARHGIVEALKARHFIYRVMLGYFLWMAKLSERAQWGVIIGGYVGYRLLRNVARNNPALQPWIMPLLILYIAFAIMTWVSSPLFNLLLRLNRFGRLALSREQIVTSNWVGLCVAGAVVSLLLYFTVGGDGPLVSALVCGLLIPPLATIYQCERGWPRITSVLITIALTAAGVTSAALVWSSQFLAEESARLASGLGWLLFFPFLLGAIGFQFAANVLVSAKPRR